MYHLAKVSCLFMAFATCSTISNADEPCTEMPGALVGAWSVSGTAAGMELAGTIDAKWADSKSCVVTDYKFKLGDDSLAGNHIIGFDSATKSYRVLGFFSHGVVEDYSYAKESDGVYKGIYAGSRDGQKFQGKLTVTVSANTVKFESAGLKRGGEPTPELCVTLTRAKD